MYSAHFRQFIFKNPPDRSVMKLASAAGHEAGDERRERGSEALSPSRTRTQAELLALSVDAEKNKKSLTKAERQRGLAVLGSLAESAEKRPDMLRILPFIEEATAAYPVRMRGKEVPFTTGTILAIVKHESDFDPKMRDPRTFRNKSGKLLRTSACGPGGCMARHPSTQKEIKQLYKEHPEIFSTKERETLQNLYDSPGFGKFKKGQKYLNHAEAAIYRDLVSNNLRLAMYQLVLHAESKIRGGSRRNVDLGKASGIATLYGRYGSGGKLEAWPTIVEYREALMNGDKKRIRAAHSKLIFYCKTEGISQEEIDSGDPRTLQLYNGAQLVGKTAIAIDGVLSLPPSEISTGLASSARVKPEIAMKIAQAVTKTPEEVSPIPPPPVEVVEEDKEYEELRVSPSLEPIGEGFFARYIEQGDEDASQSITGKEVIASRTGNITSVQRFTGTDGGAFVRVLVQHYAFQKGSKIKMARNPDGSLRPFYRTYIVSEQNAGPQVSQFLKNARYDEERKAWVANATLTQKIRIEKGEALGEVVAQDDSGKEPKERKG